MKKAILLIPVGLVVGGFLYYINQVHKFSVGLSNRYPTLSIHGQIKRGRTRYIHLGR